MAIVFKEAKGIILVEGGVLCFALLMRVVLLNVEGIITLF